MANPSSIRLLVAEDVPQVSQHVRNLLSVQSQVKLLEVLNDGSKVVEAARQLRPDVVMVDLLLQGKLKGPQLIEKLRDSGLEIPVVVLTVPQHPLARDPARGIDAVLTLPFSGFELVNTLQPRPGGPPGARLRGVPRRRRLLAQGRRRQDDDRLQPGRGARPDRASRRR